MAQAIRGPKGTRQVVICAALLAAALLPAFAHADTIVTFDWVSGTPTPENPTSAASVTPGGTLTLDVSSFALTGTANPPNLGQYYASGGNAATVSIVGLNYEFADGAKVSLSNVTSMSVGSTTTPWQTSGLVIPGGVAGGTAANYYLISGFTLSGTANGANFQIGNVAGTAGATFANGVANGGNSFNGTAAYPAVTDGGYWQLASVTTVPLPAALPLLLSGLGMTGLFGRRRRLEPRLS